MASLHPAQSGWSIWQRSLASSNKLFSAVTYVQRAMTMPEGRLLTYVLRHFPKHQPCFHDSCPRARAWRKKEGGEKGRREQEREQSVLAVFVYLAVETARARGSDDRREPASCGSCTAAATSTTTATTTAVAVARRRRWKGMRRRRGSAKAPAAAAAAASKRRRRRLQGGGGRRGADRCRHHCPRLGRHGRGEEHKRLAQRRNRGRLLSVGRFEWFGLEGKGCMKYEVSLKHARRAQKQLQKGSYPSRALLAPAAAHVGEHERC